MTKIVVSGAAGYLGGRLVEAFLKNGCSFLGIVHKQNENLRNLSLKYENLEICELEIDDLLYSMSKFYPTVVISTTCSYETDAKYLIKTIDSNYIFPSKLLKCAIQLERKMRFISISTSLPPSLNLYSLTKEQFSESGKYYSSIGKIQFVNVLLESFYGADEPDERFIKRSVKNFLLGRNVDATIGTQKRDYVEIDDVIDVLMFLSATENLKSDYDTIQLGSGFAPSIREILGFLNETVGTKSVINFGAVPSRPSEPSTKADLSRLRELGYTKEMTYWKDGMKKMGEEIKNESID